MISAAARHASRRVALRRDFARLDDVVGPGTSGSCRREHLTDQPSWLPTTETNDTISPG